MYKRQVRVTDAEIDDNGHMNNVAYVRRAQEAAPGLFRGLEVVYDRKCFRGALLTLEHAADADAQYVRGVLELSLIHIWNFLAALHAYGCSGAMLGKVGADTFGDLLCTTLAQAGIRTEGIVRDPSVFTTLAFVTFGPGGERAFSFARKPGADTQLRFDELDLSLLDEAQMCIRDRDRPAG